jgi:hypothetical protein
MLEQAIRQRAYDFTSNGEKFTATLAMIG